MLPIREALIPRERAFTVVQIESKNAGHSPTTMSVGIQSTN